MTENLESKDKRLIGKRTILRIEIRIRLEEDVSKADSKVCTINIKVLLAWHIYFLATWTIDLDTRSRELFGEADRQYNLSITENTLASAKDTQQELFSHHGKTAR